MASSVDRARTSREVSSNDCTMLGVEPRKLTPCCRLLEALDRVGADGEKRQRTRQLVPDPFDLQRRLEPPVAAQRDRHVADDGQTTPRATTAIVSEPVEAVDHLTEALLVRPPLVHHCSQGKCRVVLDVLPSLCQHGDVHMPRLQALSDTDAGHLVGDDDDLLARPKYLADKLADVVQELGVVTMEVNRVPAARDSRERRQTWHVQPPR